MYPITNEVKALFESEQRKVLRITGKPMKKEDVSVGPSNVVTVDDAVDIPAKDITIAIEPVQDLHGYDHPWPGGGNKQLVNIPDIPETTKNGVTYRVENGVLNLTVSMLGDTESGTGYVKRAGDKLLIRNIDDEIEILTRQ